MSTYSSLIKSSNTFEKLFKILGKVFLVLAIVLLICSNIVCNPYFKFFNGNGIEYIAAVIYIMSPVIISLILSIASFIVAKCAYNIRLELPAESEKK